MSDSLFRGERQREASTTDESRPAHCVDRQRLLGRTNDPGVPHAFGIPRTTRDKENRTGTVKHASSRDEIERSTNERASEGRKN